MRNLQEDAKRQRYKREACHRLRGANDWIFWFCFAPSQVLFLCLDDSNIHLDRFNFIYVIYPEPEGLCPHATTGI